ncbi:MAG: SPOR domain-containing protein [Pseudomonadota bacterium]
MIIEAEFNEIDDEGKEAGDELDFADDDSLPWLEADEDDAGAGGVDTAQLVGFVAALITILLVAVGGVAYFSNDGGGPFAVADGSTIEAPEGPYKVRPENAGGKEFPGTGAVAPGVGQGQSPDSRLADGTGAGSGNADLAIRMPPIEGGASPTGSPGAQNAANSPRASAPNQAGAGASSPSPAALPPPSPAPANTGRVGVQLAAYSSRARAEKGWSELRRQAEALKDLDHRVVEGQIAIGTVYRLQAVTANRAEADELCRTLKSQGFDCQVKP